MISGKMITLRVMKVITKKMANFYGYFPTKISLGSVVAKSALNEQ